MTKAEHILTFIRDVGPVSLVDIKRFAARMNGHDPNERTAKGKLRWDGYYSTNLVGNMHAYCPGEMPGLLRKYCTRLPDKKWILTEAILPPFYSMPVETRSYRANRARERGEQELMIESWPQCVKCGEHRHPKWTRMSDGACELGFSSAGYSEDCQGKVWYREGTWPHYTYRETDMTKSDIVMAEAVARQIFSSSDDWSKRSEAVRKVIRERVIKHRF